MCVKLISNSVRAYFGSRISRRPQRLSRLEVKVVVYPLGPLLLILPQLPLRYVVFHRERANNPRYIQFSDPETTHFPSLRLEAIFSSRLPFAAFHGLHALQLKRGE